MKRATLKRAALLGAALIGTLAAPALAQDCPPAPEPVLSLAYGSRYTDDSASRSDIDAKGDAEADDALRPVDDFLRDLTEAANGVFAADADAPAIAACVTARIATWARAGALNGLESETANLTIGSRIAGFGLVLLQVQSHVTASADAEVAKDWLAGLMRSQMQFWEEDAPDGARQGNLRAWAAMAAATTSALRDDPVARGWAAWSVSYILCKAEADGSLPQEMKRGKYALKYQLHAIAPLVVAVRLLEQQGIPLAAQCDNALSRTVGFAVADLERGATTAAITGKEQSFFDGTDELEGFHLAWLEAYLQLDGIPDRATLEALAETYRPLNYSKLGGNQTLLWPALR